jgi:hypothetical protein
MRACAILDFPPENEIHSQSRRPIHTIMLADAVLGARRGAVSEQQSARNEARARTIPEPRGCIQVCKRALLCALRNEGSKKLKTWMRAVLLGILIVALGVPPGTMTSYARQQEGPVTPAPAQQPGAAPKQPNGQQQPSEAGKPLAQAPQVTIAVQSNVVNIDAVVTDQDGNIITGLQKQNFRVLDESQPQQISNFGASEAPITIVVLMEFSRRMWGYFGNRGKMWAYNFLDHLNAKDWVAFKTFDLKTNMISDFTQDKRAVAQ